LLILIRGAACGNVEDGIPEGFELLFLMRLYRGSLCLQRDRHESKRFGIKTAHSVCERLQTLSE